jgi:hypothetical protein
MSGNSTHSLENYINHIAEYKTESVRSKVAGEYITKLMPILTPTEVNDF